MVDFTDEVAYNAHDIDDGLQSGMLDAEELETVGLWREAIASVRRAAPGASERVLRYQAVRRVIDRLVNDLITTLAERLQRDGIDSLAAVRRVKPRLIEFSPALTGDVQQLKSFLFDRLYTHPRVTRMTQKADRIMTALFEVYMAEPRQLPAHVTRRSREEGEPMPRVIADYLAGMTDRFALEEYKKLFDPYERV